MTTERSVLEQATPDDGAPDRSDVHNWVRGIAARARLGTIAEITEVHATPWSTVLAVIVSAERFFFKAVWPPQRYEVSATALLATHSPVNVPPVMAVHEDRGWMLLADAGEPLKLRDRTMQVALLGEAVRQYAALQVAWVPRIEALRSTGVPDRRDLRPHLDRLLSAYPSQRHDTLTDAELALLRDLARDVSSMEQHLASVQPASIEHGDLHTGNILVDGADRIRIFDWGDVSIASPFLSLAVLLESLEESLGVVAGDASVDRIVEEYLAPFRLRDEDDVVGLVREARLLGSISRAVTWDHVATHVPPEDRAAYPDPVASSLRDCLRLVAA